MREEHAEDDLVAADERADAALRRSVLLDLLMPNQRALLRAVNAVLMAINDPPRTSESYHRAVRSRQRREWPALWSSLDALQAAYEKATEGDIDVVKRFLDRQDDDIDRWENEGSSPPRT